MKHIQLVPADVISLKDFEKTATPDTWVRPNGDTAIFMTPESEQVLLIRRDESPIIFK